MLLIVRMFGFFAVSVRLTDWLVGWLICFHSYAVRTGKSQSTECVVLYCSQFRRPTAVVRVIRVLAHAADGHHGHTQRAACPDASGVHGLPSI